jgi:protein tyrosine phosphatase (PTP) superfamily phosphohydrolase (DUF442 family)
MSTGTPNRSTNPVQPVGSEVYSAPPPVTLSGRGLLGRGVARWLGTGMLRVGYRTWTRIAASLFPEDSRRAVWATSVGVPLPDRLNLSWITPDLAVGGRILPEDIHRLASAGITRVVDTRSEHKDDEVALAAEGIDLLYLPTPDTYPLSVEDLQKGARWVNEQVAQRQKTLIHCEHGVGRSVLLTAAALVARGMSADRAMELIMNRRWQAAPNHRQMKRLQEFEVATHGAGATQ